MFGENKGFGEVIVGDVIVAEIGDVITPEALSSEVPFLANFLGLASSIESRDLTTGDSASIDDLLRDSSMVN